MGVWSDSLLARWRALSENIRRKLSAVLGLLPTRRWRIEQTVSGVDDVPSQIPHRRAFLVATPTLLKWLVFDCPCGTGHQIMLNLDGARWPYWRLRVSISGRITLSPSINYLGENRACHYFLKEGRVIWAKIRYRSEWAHFTQDKL